MLEAMQQRLDRQFDVVTIRRRTVEHVFGTLKHWMGSTPLLIRAFVATQIAATGQHWRHGYRGGLEVVQGLRRGGGGYLNLRYPSIAEVRDDSQFCVSSVSGRSVAAIPTQSKRPGLNTDITIPTKAKQ
ncbi:hypothetical protein FCJ57_02835 [Burkholderia diffusa]|nr:MULTISPECIES: hypothetical protein [Burkholderia cepacia complex]NTY35359.1 hypothetical protein [Burkholderia diffusa]